MAKDRDDNAAVLRELGLKAEYSPEAIKLLDDAANGLCDQAARLKREEAPRAERLAVRAKIARIVAARDLVQGLRAPRTGDVVVIPEGIG